MCATDVIIIGGGCAGMTAALEAAANGAAVALLDRSAPGIGTNSALSNGIFAGPTPHCTDDEYTTNTLLAGRGLNRESLVKLTTEHAPEAFSFLHSIGLELAELSGRYIVKSPDPDVIPGVTLVKALAARIKDSKKIDVFSDLYVTEILRDEARVIGVRGFHKKGEEITLQAPAVVLATGGAGAIYLRNDNQKSIMGQGYSLAAKAGLDLWDMEFVQFFPLVIAEPGLPSQALFSPHPEETRVVNQSGENILEKYQISLNEAIKTRRDEFSAILFREGLNRPVYLDYREVPSSAWDKHPLSLLRRVRFDFRSKPFAVSPAAHFFMGGVRTDENGQTILPGFFACGEVAWGLHGANRMAGNALTETVVFGRIAGRSAAQYAFGHKVLSSSPTGPSAKVPTYQPSRDRPLPGLRRRLREAAWRHAGVVRSEKGLKEGLADLLQSERELEAITPLTVPERRVKEDLISAVFVLNAVITASLLRKESRGAFIREDFPDQDDENWRKNSCLAYDTREKNFSLSHSSNR